VHLLLFCSNNKIFKIKVENCSNSLKDIFKSLKINIIRCSAYLLSQSEKHNNIEYIALRTETAIPIPIYGEIKPEELQFIMSEEEKEDEEVEEEEEMEDIEEAAEND